MDILKKHLRTPNLVLKEKSSEDFKRFFAMSKDPEVMKYIGDGSIFHWTEDVALEKFTLSLSIKNTEPYFEVVAYRRDINLYIGWCKISYSKFMNQTGLEYRICSDSWGNGYATETVSAVLNEIFTNLDIDTIYACTHPDNKASIRVLQKIGFRFLNTKLSKASGKQIQIFRVHRKSFI